MRRDQRYTAAETRIVSSGESVYREELAEKPWLSRFYLKLRAAFHGLSAESVLRGDKIRELEERLDRKRPSLYDPATGELGETFFEDLEAVRSLTVALRRRVGPVTYGDRGVYLRHLVREELPGVDEDLRSIGDIDLDLQDVQDQPLAEARKLISEQTDSSLKRFHERLASRLAGAWQTLAVLEELTEFSFENAMAGSGGNRRVPLGSYLPQLIRLERLYYAVSRKITNRELLRLDVYLTRLGPVGESLHSLYPRLVKAMAALELQPLIRLGLEDPFARVTQENLPVDWAKETVDSYRRLAEVNAKSRLQSILDNRMSSLFPQLEEEREGEYSFLELPEVLPAKTLKAAFTLFETASFKEAISRLYERVIDEEFYGPEIAVRLHHHLSLLEGSQETLEQMFLATDRRKAELDETMETINRRIPTASARGHRKRMYLYSLVRRIEPAVTNLGHALIEVAALVTEDLEPQKDQTPDFVDASEGWTMVAPVVRRTAETPRVVTELWEPLGVYLINMLRLELG